MSASDPNLPMTSTDAARRREFGARVIALRSGAGMSQAALAARSGLSLAYVQGVERGDKTVRILAIWQLADALGCSAADLFAVGDRH